MRALESTSRERAYDYIQHKIMDGELPPGSPVSDLSISREIGISRTPVREALSQLAKEGFVEQIPNRGAVVTQFNREDIVYQFELREALEVFAIRKAAVKGLSDGDAARIAPAVDLPLELTAELRCSGAGALNREQMKRFIGADLTFHTILLHAAGNPRILKVVNDTRLLMRVLAIPHSGHTERELEMIHQHHSNILAAVMHGEPDRAGEALSAHIRKSMQDRLDAFDAWRRDISLQGNRLSL